MNLISGFISKHRSKTALILLLLILAGTFLRFYQLSSQSYWINEAYTINAVLSIQEKGSTVLDSGKNYPCVTYCYPTAFIADKLGNDAFSFRLLAVLAGILMILISYFVSQRMFGVRVALLSSFFMAFSYWQIAWSRQARWFTLFECFFWLAIGTFYLSISNLKYRKINIALTTLFTVLAIKTQQVSYVLPFIFILWLGYLEFFIKRKFSWNKLLVTLLGVIAVTTIFELTFNLNSYLLGQMDFEYLLPYHLNFYIRNYWLFLTFMFVAVGMSINNAKSQVWFLFSTFLGTLLVVSLFTNTLHYRYEFHTTPILFILGALGMIFVFDLLKSKITKSLYIAVIIILFFTVGGGVIIPRSTYFLESDDWKTLGANREYYPVSPQPNWNAAYTYIQKHKKNTDVVVSNVAAFNKIFLNKPGYWIGDNSGYSDEGSINIYNNREAYVDAQIIGNREQLLELLRNHHGYIVLDHMGVSNGKLSDDMLATLKTLRTVFFERTNNYSYVGIYKF